MQYYIRFFYDNIGYFIIKKLFKMSGKIDQKNFEQTYQRFQSQLIDTEIKLELLREEKREKELKGVTLAPKINKNSLNLVKNTKSFLERQASFEKKKKEKAKKLIEEKKKKEEEILKKSRNTKPNKNFNTYLSHLTEWENKKKEKISKLKKENEKKEFLNKTASNHKPRPSEIDIQNALERLYKDDVIKRKQNQAVLTTIFTPSFTPRINKKKIKLNKTNDDINVTDFCETEVNDNNDLSMESYKLQQTERVENAIRKKLFRKMKDNSKPQSNLLNNTCDIIRKGGNSSTAACSEKKIKKK